MGREWAAHESAHAEVTLILASRTARRMKKPQPHAGPQEVPLRRSYLLLGSGQALSTQWEEWHRMAAAAQIRPLVAKDRALYLVLYGSELGGAVPLELDERLARKEQERDRQWQALPRDLKMAIRKIHVNLGHADTRSMLRALRVSRASEVAIKACRLFRCAECPRLQEPRIPRPSKLPFVDEFNVMIGLDVFQEKDSAGQTWSWLNILDQATTFQVVALLPDVHRNPTSTDVLEALHSHWIGWCGYPEHGVVTDRAKYFLADLAEDFDNHGCEFRTSARPSPWQIGQVERHGGIWKSIFRKLSCSQQISGRDEVLWATWPPHRPRMT